jgi:hypothetical protein
MAADMAGSGVGASPGGRPSGAGAAQRAQQQQQGDLASTLRALAEQAPSFGGAEGEGGWGACAWPVPVIRWQSGRLGR